MCLMLKRARQIFNAISITFVLRLGLSVFFAVFVQIDLEVEVEFPLRVYLVHWLHVKQALLVFIFCYKCKSAFNNR